MNRIGTRLSTPCAASVLALATFGPAAGQEPVDCCSSFDYLLERTIFKVDAVRLDLAVGGDVPARVASLVRKRPDQRIMGDSVAALYLEADRADVHMTFLRSFSLERFLGANRDVMENLARAGVLTDGEVRDLIAENTERFAILADDGVRDGDRLVHHVRGDSVTTRYTDVSGVVRIDEVRVGSEQRRVLMGSLFGPGSSFRKGLLDLVFRRGVSTP